MGTALRAAGLDERRPAFFSWLGVVPYLDDASLNTVLQGIGGHRGAEVVFDYIDPPERRLPQHRALYEQRRARVDAIGEPWKSFFDATSMHAKLTAFGFRVIEDLCPRGILARYSPTLVAHAPEAGGHVIHAKTYR